MTTSTDELKEGIRTHYGRLAGEVLAVETGSPQSCSCCDPVMIDLADESPWQGRPYDPQLLAELPDTATAASLGCGNPTAIANLQPGQVVLDLGSGGGIDCFLAARQVGPTGRVIGLDMTPAMLELAERNKARQHSDAVRHVRFIRGEMEAIPLPDAEVDVIISNCVINLSPDKDAVLREAFRVLRPGGYLAVSDTVALKPFDETMKQNALAWSACIVGSLDVATYTSKLHAAGFERVTITTLRNSQDSSPQPESAAVPGDPSSLVNWVTSAEIVAYKPAA